MKTIAWAIFFVLLSMQVALAQENSFITSQKGDNNIALGSQTGYKNYGEQNQYNGGQVFIDQIGDKNSAYQKQVNLNSEDAIAKIIQKSGDNNRAFQYQIGVSGSRPSTHEAYIMQSGNNNYASQMQENALLGKDGFYSSITQTGNYNYARTYQADGFMNRAEIMSLGNYNGTESDPVSISQKGSYNTGIIEQYGDYNAATIKQEGDNNFAKISQYGNSKSYAIEQNGNGPSVTIEIR